MKEGCVGLKVVVIKYKFWFIVFKKWKIKSVAIFEGKAEESLSQTQYQLMWTLN